MSFWADTIWLVFAGLTAFTGCGMLALSQDRHWSRAFGAPAQTTTKSYLKWGGWALVVASLVFCTLRDGGSFAALLWPMLIALGAISVAMVLAYLPKR